MLEARLHTHHYYLLFAGWRRTGVLEVTCLALLTAGEDGWRPPRLRTLGADTWCAGTAEDSQLGESDVISRDLPISLGLGLATNSLPGVMVGPMVGLVTRL